MKSRQLIFIIFISFMLFTVGCGANETALTPTTKPAIGETASEPEEVVPEPDVAEIETESITIQVGVFANSLPPLTIIEGDQYSGFEIDISTEIIDRLYGNKAVIEWVPTLSKDRFTFLEDGTIDMLVRSLMHTTSREEKVLFSGAYLLAGNAFLFFHETGITNINELDENNIVVLSYMEEGLNATADQHGFAFNSVVIENFDETSSLDLSQTAAMYHDWFALLPYYNEDTNTLLFDDLQMGPIGVGFSLDNQILRDDVDTIIEEMIADGTWNTIFEKWFEIEVPWDLDEMFSYPPQNR